MIKTVPGEVDRKHNSVQVWRAQSVQSPTISQVQSPAHIRKFARELFDNCQTFAFWKYLLSQFSLSREQREKTGREGLLFLEVVFVFK